MALAAALRDAVSPLEIRDASSAIASTQIRKDDAALRMLRAGGLVTAAQHLAAVQAAVPGRRELDIALEARAAAMEAYTELMGSSAETLPITLEWFGVVASGPDRTARAHARVTARRLVDGEVVQLCLCGRPFWSYALGFDRPVRIGSTPIEAETRLIIDAAREAQEAALGAVRPGVRACDVHLAAVAALEQHGLGRHLLHRSGRGVGASEGEAPELRDSDETPLEPGMVITVEPGCYIPTVGGARFGDTVLVTGDGYEPLTSLELGRDI